MRLQWINEAEAIIEPFFDDSDSSRTARRTSQLAHYACYSSDKDNAYAQQSWCGVSVVLNSGAPRWFEMERTCDIDVSKFDIFRVFATTSRHVFQTIRVLVDGEWQTVCDRQVGSGGTDECDYPISGGRMTALFIRLEQDGTSDCTVLYEWLGLSCAAREKIMQMHRSDFSPDWPDMIREDGNFEPKLGLMFDAVELEAIRRRVRNRDFAPLYEKLKASAEEKLTWEPEKSIGEFIPNPDRRWVRARDREKKDMSGAMQELAFVGLIERDARMMKMAARMALSAAHCGQWTESIMGALPGCGWHHRSFTEEIYCRGCALVLDWAGSWLTSYAEEIIVDAIAMKGLPRIESDFRRQEYIRSMNQGIVFSSGRVFGLLACSRFYPRYKSMIEEAERDLREIIGDYIMPDGGSPEGPMYWWYTFSHAMPILYVLARFHGKTFAETITPELEKSGRYALFLLSIVGDGCKMIPVNDAVGGYYNMMAMAAFHALTGDQAYANVVSAIAKSGAEHDSVPQLDLFVLAPDKLPEGSHLVQNGFDALPDIGQTRVIRSDEKLGRVNLVFFTGFADVGHFHMDKGSFILETEDEVLLMDRGVLSYSHPDTRIVQMPEYHNLLFPELSGARARQKPTRNGARLVSASCENGVFEAVGDITKAWADERILKDVRRITSGSPREYLIEDDMELTEDAPAAFLLNTAHPCEQVGNSVVIYGSKASLKIEPIGWVPAQVECGLYGVDSEEKPVWRIAMRSGAAKRHKLATRISFL